jgi:hypothetical protein
MMLFIIEFLQKYYTSNKNELFHRLLLYFLDFNIKIIKLRIDDIIVKSNLNVKN